MHVPNQWSQWSYIYMYVKSIDFFLFLRFFGFILDLFRQGGILCFSCYQLLKYHPVFIKCMLFYLDIPVYSYFMPVQGTVKTIDPRCWRWLENCCLRQKAEGNSSQVISSTEFYYLIYMHITTNPLKMIMSAYHTICHLVCPTNWMVTGALDRNYALRIVLGHGTVRIWK